MIVSIEINVCLTSHAEQTHDLSVPVTLTHGHQPAQTGPDVEVESGFEMNQLLHPRPMKQFQSPQKVGAVPDQPVHVRSPSPKLLTAFDFCALCSPPSEWPPGTVCQALLSKGLLEDSDLCPVHRKSQNWIKNNKNLSPADQNKEEHRLQVKAKNWFVFVDLILDPGNSNLTKFTFCTK